MLSNLKETLFKLWGDLEEQKSAMLSQKAQGKSKTERMLPKSSTAVDSESEDEENHLSQINRGIPPDPDQENQLSTQQKQNKKPKKPVALAEKDVNSQDNSGGETANSPLELKPNNKPFECCIKQYGIRVAEEDPEKADAGEGKRWQRVFGLWGTLIK